MAIGKFELRSEIQELIDDEVITVSVSFGKFGSKCENITLLKPLAGFEESEVGSTINPDTLINRLEQYARESAGDPTLYRDMEVQQALNCVLLHKLDDLKGPSGTLNKKPSGSLVIEDLSLSYEHLMARAVCVAHAIGNGRATSRVSKTLGDLGAKTLSEWWDRATPEDKFTLMSHKKHKPKNFEHVPYLSKLGLLPFPFRGFDEEMELYLFPEDQEEMDETTEEGWLHQGGVEL